MSVAPCRRRPVRHSAERDGGSLREGGLVRLGLGKGDMSKNRGNYTHSTRRCPAKLSLNDTQRRSAHDPPRRLQDDFYLTSSSSASCPAVRNVFTSSPSPQTVIPGNLLYHLPSGTSAWVSSQSANSPS